MKRISTEQDESVKNWRVLRAGLARWPVLAGLIMMVAHAQAVAPRAGEVAVVGAQADEPDALETRVRSTLAEVGLRVDGPGSGAIPIRDGRGQLIGLAAVAFGAEPGPDSKAFRDVTSEQRRHAAGIAARIAARREMLAYLGREIAVRDSMVKHCRTVWEQDGQRERARSVEIEEVSTEVEETVAGLLARSCVLESLGVEGGVRVMVVALPEGAARHGGMVIEAATPEIARTNLLPEILAGSLPNPGTRILVDRNGRPHAVVGWCLREGRDRAAEIKARAGAQRALQSFLSGDDIKSRTLFREWSRMLVTEDSTRTGNPAEEVTEFGEGFEDRIISRVSGQAKQLGDPIRSDSGTVVFVHRGVDDSE